MRLMITAAAALFCWATNASAEQVTLKALGAAVVLPPQWIVTQGGDSTRRWAAFKPSKDADANNALRCRIDKNQLPERFRNMTQAQINELQARAPLSAPKFAEQLQMDGVLPTVVENGDGMIDTSHASWAITTTSETKGATTAYYKSKIALPQTPGYGWNLQCIAVSTGGPAGANAVFIASKSIIDQFFQSFHYLPIQN
ncbi:hypothetical protein [Variovorax sp. tm]|uniref:hypothetical protein n=1 Tax=Variovorax atrisoli TaxID=3394203 RepID=UPI003A7FA78A